MRDPLGAMHREMHKAHLSYSAGQQSASLKDRPGRRGSFVMNFGKYHGRLLGNVPREYLRWVSANASGVPENAMKAIRQYLDQCNARRKSKVERKARSRRPMLACSDCGHSMSVSVSRLFAAARVRCEQCGGPMNTARECLGR